MNPVISHLFRTNSVNHAHSDSSSLRTVSLYVVEGPSPCRRLVVTGAFMVLLASVYVFAVVWFQVIDTSA